MAKISKNIKTLRIDKRLTQEELAESIRVTRQTISSWETNRTQPDIDMLEALSEFFGVGVEELIYGEKRNVGLEADPKSDRKIFSIILAVLGSAFVVVGLVFLFVDLWFNFSLSVKTVLSFLPLVIGFFLSLFVYFKKYQSIPFREGASVIWSAGFIATMALVWNLYSFDYIDYLLLICAVLILPIFYVMRSVFPVVLYFILVMFFYYGKISFYSFSDTMDVHLFISLLLFLAAGYTAIFKNKTKDLRYHFAVWFGVVMAGFSLPLLPSVFTPISDIFAILLVPSFLIALFAFDNGERQKYPFRFPAAILLVAQFTFQTIIALQDNGSFLRIKDYSEYIPVFVLCILIVALGIYLGRKSIFNNPLKLAFLFFSVLTIVSLMVSSYAILITTIALDFVIFLMGVKKAKLSTSNLGLASISFILFAIIFGSEFEAVTKGVTCIIIGAVFIAVNYFMSKYFASKNKAQEANINA
ncbi:MAG: helix-turn-helix transcriptional regulator [Clostridiales bacterium]|nr:helix-turn-helix transcriptional regulator [Clostridiales bacterium]